MGKIYQREEAGVWHATFTGSRGQRVRKSTGTTDRRLATSILAEWEKNATMQRSGLVDSGAVKMAEERERPLVDHLADFFTSTEAAGGSETELNAKRNRFARIITDTGWQWLDDLNASDFEQAIVSLKSNGRYKNSRPRSNKTIATYIGDWRSFADWCVRRGRISSNPIASVEKPSLATDRRLVRRMLMPEEWPWLARAAGQKSIQGVPPEERPILYEFAIQTGYRADEIRHLRVGQLFLDQDKPHAFLPADATKNEQEARQRITPDLAGRMAEMLKRLKRKPRNLVFTLHTPNTAIMVRSDLKRARKAWLRSLPADQVESAEASDFLQIVDSRGQRFDFHALRHTCGAWLAMDGMHPKAIQAVMRHSTISLTLDTYGHLMPGALDESLEVFSKIFD